MSSREAPPAADPAELEKVCDQLRDAQEKTHLYTIEMIDEFARLYAEAHPNGEETEAMIKSGAAMAVMSLTQSAAVPYIEWAVKEDAGVLDEMKQAMN